MNTPEYVVLITLLNVRGEILLGLKKGTWGLLGGHYEKTDQGGRRQTVLREVLEESQLERVIGLRHFFNHDDEKRPRLFDVYIGHYYGNKPPAPLLTEDIVEVRWFNPADAKVLRLTQVAR